MALKISGMLLRDLQCIRIYFNGSDRYRYLKIYRNDITYS